jgi:hypothetical protein
VKAVTEFKDFPVLDINHDGSNTLIFEQAGWLHTMIPPDSFYTYDMPAKTLPLYALGRYRARLAAAG